ncbi:Ig-like domain-containing protein [Halobacterium litoreum]|nr:Ig-like domain-containing protein [Halobacterium litoreum]
MVLSVMVGSIAFAGSAAAASNAGPEEFSDLGTDAGTLAAGETAVVQTIEVNDTDADDGTGDTNPVNVTKVNVSNAGGTTVSASNVSEVRILDASGNELASAAPSGALSTGQTFDITNVTIPDNGSTTLQVEVTIAPDATEDGNTLELATKANWTEGPNSGQTAYVTDGVAETLDTVEPGLSSASTADNDNDGSVDTITVMFSEDVQDSSVEASDFSLSDGSVDSVDTSPSDNSTVHLTVSDVGDTAATPNVNLSAGSVTDVAGNAGPAAEEQVTATDNANPAVTDKNLNKTLVNDADAPATVEVNVTFSENVTAGTVQIVDSGLATSPLDVTGSVDNDTFSGTVTINDNNDDVEANLSVTGFSGENGNTQEAYSQQALTIDTQEDISINSAETADLNDDGTVETINVTFSDAVDDSTVLTAIENDDFNLKSATVEDLNGGEANDATVSLEVSGLGNTAATDELSLFSNSIEDTAGNPGPTTGTFKPVSDGAKPVVTDVTLNVTELNESDVPADVEVNVSFSEKMGTDPSVTLVGLSQGDITASPASADDGDANLSATTVSQIADNDEDVSVYVNVSDGDDSSGNAVETWNQSDLTVDTLAPSVTVNNSEAPEGEIVSGELDLSTFFDISEDDGGETTYLINTTAGGSNYSEVNEQFDTNSIDDTAHLTVRAVDTDNVGNSDNATTADINVDNTAPQVTIQSPSETTARQSGGVLDVTVDVTEQNLAADNATLVLSDGNKTIQYNASLSDGSNEVDLLLNTSENASDASAIEPNLSATNTTFDTQTVYDLSVTVDDSTGKSTTATQTDALFLDDTAPANFSLVAPSEATEYDPTVEGEDELVVSYGYTEDNVDTVTVSLTNESGAVANVTVDESQYTDDGVIKSFELDLVDSFDTGSLADGRYNVSVTVTDLAGNKLVDNTTNAPVAINAESPSDGTPSFQGTTPTATASIGEDPENVTVEATYNVSVPEVTDAGAIEDPQNSLENVDVTAPNATVVVDYYDASEGKYLTYTEEVAVDFSGENATANATITESVTVDISDVGPSLDDGDRVLKRTASLSGNVGVDVEASYGTASNTDAVDTGTTTFVDNETVAPTLDSIEVDGDVSATSDELVLTFDRPVQATAAGITADDFAYINENGNVDNYVTAVSGVGDGDTQVTVTLNGAVEAGDVGSDIVSIQPDVLENTESPNKNVSATSDTFAETTAPVLTDATVGDDASTVTVTFDEQVQAANGSDLTAANFSYSGSANVTSVSQTADDTVVVTLDASVTSGEIGSAEIAVSDVYDRFGNSLTDSTAVTDGTKPSDLQIVQPTQQTTVKSDDLLDVTYGYVENVPDNAETTEITLTDNDGTSYTFTVDDTQYVAGVNKTVTLDLGNKGTLEDGAYHVEITVTDADSNEDTVQTEDAVVVVNDEAPTVSDVSIASDTSDIASDSTLNVTYDYDPAPNATSVTVWVVDSEDAGNFTSGDLANASYTTYEKSVDHGVVDDRKLSVDLGGEIADNDDYTVFVTATDADEMQSDAAQASSTLDVNAEKPSIESVEANAGSDTVTVQFTEAVVPGDDDANITRADFAYQNVNGAGASAIESVAVHDGDTVTLELDAEVTSGDLGSDHVNARGGQIVDTDGDNARVVGTDAVALSDSTQPTVGSVDAGAINANNADSYDVTVDTGSEVTDVSVTVTGSNGTSVSDSATAVTGEATLTVNASALEDGSVTVDVTVTDAAGNEASASRTVTKDTDAPTIESATTNAGTNTVTVTFSEDVTGVSASALGITSSSHEVIDVVDDGSSDATVLVVLNESVPAAAINDSSVAQITAAGVTDVAGNPVASQQKLTDVDAPSVMSVTADRGDENVTITFSENVDAGEEGALNASDFAYTDANDAGASGIESVTQTGPQTVVLTLNGSLTPSDMAEDTVGIEADSVFDSVGHPVAAHSSSIGITSDVSVSTTEDSVTVTVVSPNNVSTAIDSPITVEKKYRELGSLEGFELNERYTKTLKASDFEKVEAGVYEATVSVDEDGVYVASGTVDSMMMSAEGMVDAEAPHPTDAVITDVTSEAQLDDTRDTTRVRVLFNEPIDASEILPSDVSIEGFDGEVVAVQPAGPLGSVTVVVEGKVQTGAYPDVTIDGDSYTDLAGTAGEEGGDTVVHTDTLDLSKGQNFVSVPAASGELDLDELDTSEVDAIYAYDAASNEWEAYDPDAKENDFSALEGGEGYVFVMDEAATLEVNVYNVAGAEAGAAAPAPNQQELTEGWNLVGQFQEYDQSVTTALSSLGNDSVYSVLSQDESADGIAYESYGAGDFETMERGEAYWLFVQDDEVYTESSGHTVAV